MNKLWVKSEAFVENGKATDGVPRRSTIDRFHFSGISTRRLESAMTWTRIPDERGARLESRDWRPTFSSSNQPFTSAIGVASQDV